MTGGSRGIGRCVRRVAGASRRRRDRELPILRDERGGDGGPINATGRQGARRSGPTCRPPTRSKRSSSGVRAAWGSLDILVNNAGIIADALVAAMEPADWDRVIEVNLRGAFLCTRAAMPLMLPRHAGKIINVASVSALGGGRGQANYAAAKGGLVAFSRACAVELAPKGIQVNAVLPGMISTEMSARARKRGGERLLEAIPSGRFGLPEEVAQAVSSWLRLWPTTSPGRRSPLMAGWRSHDPYLPGHRRCGG